MEKTVAQRLAALEALQAIDSQLDEIKKVRVVKKKKSGQTKISKFFG